MTPSQPSLEELAQQIGLEDEFSAHSTPSDDLPGEIEGPGPLPLDDLDDYLETDVPSSPDAFITQPAFYNTGISKAALVGGVGLFLFLGMAWIFSAAAPGGNGQDGVVATEPEEAPEDPTLAALRKSRAAESKARAKLALLQQSKSASNGAAAEDAVQEDAEVTDAEAEDAAVQTVAVAPPPPPTAPPPPARIRPSATYNTVRPQPASVSPPPAPPPISAGLSRQLGTASAPVDPMAEWQRLAQAGNYGQVERSSDAPSFSGGADANATVAALFPGSQGWSQAVVETAMVETAAVETDAGASTGFGYASTAAPLSDYFERSEPPIQLAANWQQSRSKTVLNALPEEDADLVARTEAIESERSVQPTEPAVVAQQTAYNDNPERTILVGSSGQGHLVTPVIWAPDGSRGEARFIVNLSQPILDAQGEPALPAETQFVVAAQNLDPESGLVDLTVTALLIEGREYEAPEGVFSVRDRQGGLLLGQLMNQPNQGRGDTVRILTGALTQVGKLMNRPRSTSTSSTSGRFGSSQSSTTENRDPNYVGAVLEGGFEEFASVMEERQAAAAEALAKAPQLYQLKADHPIRIFVNQSLSL